MRKEYKPAKSQKGFTIVELLMATTVFSVVLLVVTTGIVRIGQAYYKGINEARTQEATRFISEDISRNIQLSKGEIRNVAGDEPGEKVVCIGTAQYTYYLNRKVVTNDDGTVTEGVKYQKIEPEDECGNPVDPGEPRELLGNNMRVLHLNVEASEADPIKTWNVQVRVAYGDNDLLSHYDSQGNPNGWGLSDDPATVPAIRDATCKSGISGSAFCATAQLDTLVKKRLNN